MKRNEKRHLTMKVVTRHMMTMTEKVFVLNMPALTPSEGAMQYNVVWLVWCVCVCVCIGGEGGGGLAA